MEKSTNDKLTKTLFVIYIMVITWIILFKVKIDVSTLGGLRSINLNPFDDVFTSSLGPIKEKLYNIIIFIPFGVYIGMLRKNSDFLQKVLVMAAVSFLYEILQFIFAIGVTDICDLINNTFGGVIGLIGYTFIMKLFRNKRRINWIINALASMGTICVVTMLAIVVLANGFF